MGAAGDPHARTEPAASPMRGASGCGPSAAVRWRCGGRPDRATGSRGQAGFTLVEVLVALAVLAAVTVVIQRGVVAATGSVARAADLASAERVARTLLATPLGPLDGSGTRAGALAGHQWSMSLEPMPAAAVDAEGEALRWQPVRVRLVVSAGAARPVEVETVRIVRAVP